MISRVEQIGTEGNREKQGERRDNFTEMEQRSATILKKGKVDKIDVLWCYSTSGGVVEKRLEKKKRKNENIEKTKVPLKNRCKLCHKNWNLSSVPYIITVRPPRFYHLWW